MRIRFLFQLLLASILFVNLDSRLTAAQSSNNVRQIESNQQIVKEIDKKLAKLRKTVSIIDKSAASATVRYREAGRILKIVAYSDKNRIRKVVADAEDADRTSTIELYYDDDAQPIFAYERILFRDKKTRAVTQKMRDEYEFENGDLQSVYSGIVFFKRDQQNPKFVRYRDDIARLSQNLLAAVNRGNSAPNK